MKLRPTALFQEILVGHALRSLLHGQDSAVMLRQALPAPLVETLQFVSLRLLLPFHRGVLDLLQVRNYALRLVQALQRFDPNHHLLGALEVERVVFVVDELEVALVLEPIAQRSDECGVLQTDRNTVRKELVDDHLRIVRARGQYTEAMLEQKGAELDLCGGELQATARSSSERHLAAAHGSRRTGGKHQTIQLDLQ